MNKQGPGKIGWTDWTWNPIKGLCPVGCWYCYARAMYERFRLEPRLSFDFTKELEAPCRLKNPSKIFLCSTIEFFHPDIPNNWRGAIFDVIEQCPQHTFQILTKMPENIDREMPENVWLGVSMTAKETQYELAQGLLNAKARLKFISFEPLLDIDYFLVRDVRWVIIGRLTGHGRQYDPKFNEIEKIIKIYRKNNIPVFLKHNLKDIWGPNLIQEWPE